MPGPDLYEHLRVTAIFTDPDELGLAPTERHPNVFGGVLEMWFREGAYTLLAVADGTARG